MKPIVFPIKKAKIITKRNLAIALIILLLAVGVGYFFLQKIDRLPQFNFGSSFQKLAASLTILSQKETKKEIKKEEVKPEELKITLPSPSPKVYEETAEAGEGITHLARKALRDYLKEKGSDLNLTAEHKIYIEGYLQKKTGDRWLKLGEKISFSEELIKEAIEKSQQLSEAQLENLKQYSALVSSF